MKIASSCAPPPCRGSGKDRGQFWQRYLTLSHAFSDAPSSIKISMTCAASVFNLWISPSSGACAIQELSIGENHTGDAAATYLAQAFGEAASVVPGARAETIHLG